MSLITSRMLTVQLQTRIKVTDYDYLKLGDFR